MVGPFINSAGIILGGILGVLLARHVPTRLQEGLPATFALASISIGIVMVVKVSFMPAVILALIVGTALGELLSLEQGVKWGANKTRGLLERIIPSRSYFAAAGVCTKFYRNDCAILCQWVRGCRLFNGRYYR